MIRIAIRSDLTGIREVAERKDNVSNLIYIS